MTVKDKYNHSISLTQEAEKKLDTVRALGYSMPQIMDVGMDELLAMNKDQEPLIGTGKTIEEHVAEHGKNK
jgi:hypothetical protein